MNKWRIYSVMAAFLSLLLSRGACLSSGVDYGTVDSPRTICGTVSVPRTTEGVVDIDVLLADIEPQVQVVLPGAYLRGIVFSGQAEKLVSLDGEIVFDFVSVRSRVLWEKIIVASATVEAEQQTLRIQTMDVTGHYPSINRLDLNQGLSLEEISTIAYAQLENIELEGREITLTRLQDSEEWVVSCREIETLEQECRFKIDAITGEVTTSE